MILRVAGGEYNGISENLDNTLLLKSSSMKRKLNG